MASGSQTNVPVDCGAGGDERLHVNRPDQHSPPQPPDIARVPPEPLRARAPRPRASSSPYCIFELPGGLFAFRVGAKKLLVVGGLITSAAAVASAASPTFDVLIALRFLTGMGLGFAFPPVVVLLIRNLKTGSAGLGATLVLDVVLHRRRDRRLRVGRPQPGHRMEGEPLDRRGPLPALHPGLVWMLPPTDP